MNIRYCVVLLSVCCIGCAATKYNPPQDDADMHSIDDGSMQKIPWAFEGDEGERFMNDVWDIRTTMKYQHIVDSLPSFYTALLQRYSTVFGEFPLPASQMDVYLFATQEQWQSQLVKMLGCREAQHWFQLESGGITIDGKAILYHLDRRGRSRVTLRIAAHEGWHQYAEKIFKKPIPTWLDEGIGTWMEGFRLRRNEVQFLPASNWDRLTTLRRIVAGNRLHTLDELMNSDPSDLLETDRSTLLGYYAQLWGLVSFIIESDNGKYFPALQLILESALQGTIQEPNQGWLFCFAEDPVEFEKEYNTWIVEYVKPGTSWR
ncbi:MAG: DUF1570 domain-containing protein [Phycisphaerae bacterium]|nr:DUF1570 domain-containing protein [Phycisphaerae bacterium]MBT6165379.1 DUF1570 domain-containing protein [Phycisphaerae bacterium]